MGSNDFVFSTLRMRQRGIVENGLDSGWRAKISSQSSIIRRKLGTGITGYIMRATS